MNKKLANPAVKFLQENLVAIGIVLLMVVTAIINPKFVTLGNFTNVLRQLGALPFVALGMTFVIIGGFIDLSVPGILSLTAVVAVSMVDTLGQVGAIALALLLGAMLGYLNGSILTGSGAMTQAEVLFITYGMSSIYMAIGLLFTNAETLRLMRSTNPITIFTALSSTVAGIPVIVIVFVVLLIIMHIFLNKTLAGRSITLLGGNKDAAYLCGFNTKRTMRMIYAINGLFAALGGIALVSRVTTATATCGTGYETDAILCVVVGGTSLKGGKGNVLRTMLGVVLITLLGNCMNMLGLSTYMQSVMRGAVLVVAIWLDNRRAL